MKISFLPELIKTDPGAIMKDLKMLVAQGAGGGHFQLIDLGKAVSGLVADIVLRTDADLLGLGH